MTPIINDNSCNNNVLYGERSAAIGLIGWIILVSITHSWIGVISALLMLGPLVVVPLGISLIRPEAAWLIYAAPFGAAAVVVRASDSNTRAFAVVFALVWLIATLITAIPAGWAWVTRPTGKRFDLDYFLPLAALAELCVGAAWLVAATMHVELLGFSESIVLLTAVHFHMAGFGACSVAVVRMRASQSTTGQESERDWCARAALVVLVASPVVAIGHLTIGILELSGGMLLTGGVWTLGFVGWRQAKRVTGAPRILLLVGAFAPIAPMILAVHYGLTRVTDLTPLPYNTIAYIHGSLNALGFLAANLLAANLSKRRV